jgi:hypothetical protein
MPRVTFHGITGPLPYGLLGLLGGMSAALGLLSPRPRLSRTS